MSEDLINLSEKTFLKLKKIENLLTLNSSTFSLYFTNVLIL